MHQSFVTKVPHPGEGRGIAGQVCRVFTFVLSPLCGGNTGDFIYIEQTWHGWQCNVNHKRLWG